MNEFGEENGICSGADFEDFLKEFLRRSFQENQFESFNKFRILLSMHVFSTCNK